MSTTPHSALNNSQASTKDIDNRTTSSPTQPSSSSAPAHAVDKNTGSKINQHPRAGLELRDVESVNSDGSDVSTEPMSKEKRLVILQSERFRRALERKEKRGRRKLKTRWGQLSRERSSLDFDNLYEEQEDVIGDLRIVNYPWTIWALGFVITIATTIFLDRVHHAGSEIDAERDFHDLKPRDPSDGWKYIVALVLYIGALGIIISARVETLVVSHDDSKLFVTVTKPCCLPIAMLRGTRCTERNLKDIVDIRVEACGEFSGDVDTRSYKVHFEFNDHSHLTVLDSRSKNQALKKCHRIKSYLFRASSTTIVVRRTSASGLEDV